MKTIKKIKGIKNGRPLLNHLTSSFIVSISSFKNLLKEVKRSENCLYVLQVLLSIIMTLLCSCSCSFEYSFCDTAGRQRTDIEGSYVSQNNENNNNNPPVINPVLAVAPLEERIATALEALDAARARVAAAREPLAIATRIWSEHQDKFMPALEEHDHYVNLSKQCDVTCARAEELYKNSLINGSLNAINNHLEAKEIAEIERRRITYHTDYLFMHKVVPLCKKGGDLSEIMGDKRVIL